jgi:acyl-CoA thioester hydrolase
MYKKSIKLRVRYGETDKMGVVYHSNYINYYEVARTECIRSLGLPYSELEDRGVILPVTKVESVYKDSLYYDDEVEVVAKVREMPGYKIIFDYDVLKEGTIVNYGVSELVFYDVEKKRPCKAPIELVEALKPYFNE